jgi:uncharacterized membrane protein YhaH (DUF805 family)
MDRRTYAIRGAGLIVLKYVGDATLIAAATGQRWTPLDYLDSVALLYTNLWQHAPAWLLPTLTAWTLPFLWIGVTYTMRRARDAGLSPWLALGFFVPYANDLLMLVMALLPGSPRSVMRPTLPAGSPDRWTVAAAVAVGTGAAYAMVVLTVTVFRAYGLALFFATPFVSAAVGGFLLNRRSHASEAATIGVTALTFVAAGGALLLFGREGLACLVMALPLALPIAILGALFGRHLAREDGSSGAPAIGAMLVLPLAVMLEPTHATGRVLHEVRTDVVIDAPAAAIWPHVVAFAPIREPLPLIFALGVASPQSAHIEGRGVGAVRYCEFSTGAFVEPITEWDPGRRLAFDVSSSPAPLRELSPYGDIRPPHLDGYLRAKRGEFRLVPISSGRTRLEGRTWYELEMAPEGYWQLWTDALIHRIHRRVLTHIAAEVDAEHRPTVAR